MGTADDSPSHRRLAQHDDTAEGSLWRRYYVPVILAFYAVFYLVAFVPAIHVVGNWAAALPIPLVIAAGWFFGLWGGLLFGLLTFPLHTLLYNLAGHPGWAVLIHSGEVSGNVMLLLVGAAVGWQRDIGKRLRQELAERQRAEAALLESETRFRTIAEATSVPMAITRRSNGTILYANAHFGPTFGLRAEEVIGRKAPDFYYDPADRQAVLAALAKDGYLRDYEVQAKKADGRPFWVVVSAQPLTFNGEQAIFVTFFDITERKRMEETLRRSEQALKEHRDRLEEMVAERTAELRAANAQLQQEVAERRQAEASLRQLSRAVEQSPGIVMITGTDGNIEYVNPKFCEVTGYAADEVIGQNPRILKSGEMPPEVYQQLWDTIAAGGEWRGELHNRKKSGAPYWVFASISPIKNAAGAITHFVSVQEDITARKQTEVALQASHERLEQALVDLQQSQQAMLQQERLRALGQMASGIVHDINNALSPILGFTELLLLREQTLSDHARQRLEIIRTAASDISQIVTRMREFYRQREETEPLAPVDLNSLVQQVLALTRPRWKDIPQGHGITIEVQTDLPEGLPPVLGVESEVREALTNLMLNAVDAMPTDGCITVRTRATARHIILEVRDEGTGMDEETRQRCLEPFYTTKGEGGTGLGLPMVYGVMQRHEGDIQIESVVGQGTTVRLLFPRREPAAAAPVVAPPAATVSGSSGRVLYIDDEPRLRELVGEMLASVGYRVDVADGGQAGVELFRAAQAQGQPFAVVITDLGMPYMDGREVARLVKQASPATPVILLTGWGTRLSAEGAIPGQVDVVVGKPPKLAELQAALAQVTPTPAKSTPSLG